MIDYATETLVDGVPLARFFGQATPASIFAHILKGVAEGEVVDFGFPSRPRKQVLDPLACSSGHGTMDDSNFQKICQG